MLGRCHLETLRFAEEIVLLLLHDGRGKFAHVPDWSSRYAFGGSILMDLALENRIDTDLEKLVLLDATPVGDSLLDPMLAEIAQEPEPCGPRYWVERAGSREEEIREGAVQRLVERGILERRENRILWVFHTQRHEVVDDKASRQVKLRIMNMLFGDELPSPRDVVTICLADACGIFRELLSASELEQATERIQQLRRMDLIGQAVAKAIWDIETSLASTVQLHVY